MPGHHNQIALQQELEMQPWRRYTTFFTAFVEGWGLYSERLGIDMGIYDTPEKDMGRLSYEMWRACRLVVDTGIHAKGWDERAGGRVHEGQHGAHGREYRRGSEPLHFRRRGRRWPTSLGNSSSANCARGRKRR